MWVLSVIVSVIVFEVLLKKFSRKMEMLWLRFFWNYTDTWHVVQAGPCCFVILELEAPIQSELNRLTIRGWKNAVEYFSLISFCFVGREGGRRGTGETQFTNYPKVVRMFPNTLRILRKFPKTFENIRRLPRKIRRCFDLISINFGSLSIETWQTLRADWSKIIYHEWISFLSTHVGYHLLPLAICAIWKALGTRLARAASKKKNSQVQINF